MPKPYYIEIQNGIIIIEILDSEGNVYQLQPDIKSFTKIVSNDSDYIEHYKTATNHMYNRI